MTIGESIARQRQKALDLHHSGHFKQAEQCYRTVLAAHPQDGETWHLLAVLYGQQGQHERVIDSCHQAIQSGHQKASVFANLGIAFRHTGQVDEASAALRQALQLDPSDADLTLEYLALLMEQGDERAALYTVGQACKRFAQDERMHTEMGKLAVSLNDGQLAEESFRHALRLQPESFELWLNLGSILLLRGDMPGAEYAYRKALKISPGSPIAWWYINQLPAARADVDIRSRTLQWAASDDSPASAPVHFAAAVILDEQGKTDAAFEAWSTGNRLVRNGYHYRVENDEENLRQLAAALPKFTATSSAPSSPPDPADRADVPMPIFIVGLPRSGSTLLEQQLARHPDIDAGGENVWLQRLTARAMKQSGLRYPVEQLSLPQEALAKIREAYLQTLAIRSRQGRFMTDKLPGNFICIPTIRQLFPTALIVHACRDDLETCWSCYRYLFSARQSFAYDLEEVGRYCVASRWFIESCQANWPRQVVTVHYESLVAQPLKTLAGLATRLGLSWTPEQLAPAGEVGFVQTASSAQLHGGMARQAMRSSHRYQSHLGLLREVLGEAPPASQAPD